MSIPATGFYEIDLGGTVTKSLDPILIPANSNIRAHVMMVQESHSAAAGSVEVYISQYVQNGTLQTGKFYLLLGSGITEVIFTASVTNSSVKGTLVIEFF